MKGYVCIGKFGVGSTDELDNIVNMRNKYNKETNIYRPICCRLVSDMSLVKTILEATIYHYDLNSDEEYIEKFTKFTNKYAIGDTINCSTFSKKSEEIKNKSSSSQ